MSENKCVWNMGTPCSGELKEQLIFDGQVKVLICDKHKLEHIDVITLHSNGYKIETILQMSAQERRKEI